MREIEKDEYVKLLENSITGETDFTPELKTMGTVGKIIDFDGKGNLQTQLTRAELDNITASIMKPDKHPIAKTTEDEPKKMTDNLDDKEGGKASNVGEDDESPLRKLEGKDNDSFHFEDDTSSVKFTEQENSVLNRLINEMDIFDEDDISEEADEFDDNIDDLDGLDED